MNSKLFCVALLTTTALSHSAMNMKMSERCGDTKVKIEHKTVRIIDGTPLIDMKKILALEEEIKKMQFGDNKGKGLFIYGNKQVTIKDLVEIERTKGRGKALRESLNEAIAHYEKITRGYLSEARGFKAQMCALITQWAKQRNIDNSMLVEWGNQAEGQELEQLKKLATSFEIFDNLLSDLSCYLRDLRFSCKKSWAEYRTKVMGAKDGHDEL